MDSQHRHELGENVLAHWLADQIEVIKPQLPLIILVAGGVLVGSFGWMWWSDSASSVESKAWESYSIAVSAGAPNLPVLEQVVDNHSGTTVVPWAEITWADGKLLSAAQKLLLPRTREEANADLAAAEAKYEALAASRSIPAEITSRAHFGLARVAELRGEVEAAIESYGKVRGAFQQLAETRAEQLAEEDVSESVVWLATAEASAPSGLPFNPGVGSASDTNPTPDPLDLPSDTSSSEDAFSALLQSIESGAGEAESGGGEADQTEGAEAEDAAAPEGEVTEAPPMGPTTLEPSTESVSETLGEGESAEEDASVSEE